MRAIFVRTCAVTGASLILVRPLGFKTTDRWLKRAGLDYWQGVDVTFLDDLESYLDSLQVPFYFFSSKATKYHTTIDFGKDDHLIFGSRPQVFLHTIIKNGLISFVRSR